MANPDYEHEAKRAYELAQRGRTDMGASDMAAIASAAAALALIGEIRALRTELAALREQPR